MHIHLRMSTFSQPIPFPPSFSELHQSAMNKFFCVSDKTKTLSENIFVTNGLLKDYFGNPF